MYEFWKKNEQSIFSIAELEKMKKTMQKIENSTYFDAEKNNLITFAEIVVRMENKKKDIIFSVAEAMQGINMKPIEEWSLIEIDNYLKYKEKQNKQLRSKKYE